VVIPWVGVGRGGGGAGHGTLLVIRVVGVDAGAGVRITTVRGTRVAVIAVLGPVAAHTVHALVDRALVSIIAVVGTGWWRVRGRWRGTARVVRVWGVHTPSCAAGAAIYGTHVAVVAIFWPVSAHAVHAPIKRARISIVAVVGAARVRGRGRRCWRHTRRVVCVGPVFTHAAVMVTRVKRTHIAVITIFWCVYTLPVNTLVCRTRVVILAAVVTHGNGRRSGRGRRRHARRIVLVYKVNAVTITWAALVYRTMITVITVLGPMLTPSIHTLIHRTRVVIVAVVRTGRRRRRRSDARGIILVWIMHTLTGVRITSIYGTPIPIPAFFRGINAFVSVGVTTVDCAGIVVIACVFTSVTIMVIIMVIIMVVIFGIATVFVIL